MKQIERGELLGLADYEQIRPHFRDRVIRAKKARRMAVGPIMTAVFENRDTVLLQIQEMLRTERISAEPAIEHEMRTYNELVPGDNELSFTLFVEIIDPVERERMLVALDGLHEAISIEVGGQKHPVRGKREGVDPGRTTAVHYLKVTLPADTVAAWCSSDQEAFFVIDHEAYRQRVAIDGEVAQQLRADLQ